MRREKTKHHVSRIDLKLSDMRHGLAHHSSHLLLSDPSRSPFALQVFCLLTQVENN
jgi:hypothetical protein